MTVRWLCAVRARDAYGGGTLEENAVKLGRHRGVPAPQEIGWIVIVTRNDQYLCLEGDDALSVL